MKSMKLFMISLMLGLVFSMIPLAYNEYSVVNFEDLLDYLDTRMTTLGGRIADIQNEENVMAQASSGLLSLVEGVVNVVIFVGIFVLLFLNSFVTPPLLAAYSETWIERALWIFISLLVIFNNLNLIKEFYQIIVNKKSD